MSDWDSGLFQCGSDLKTCCFGFWCCPCLACKVSVDLQENHCLPLCDICSPAVLTACGLPLFVPPAGLALRSIMRERYDIQGSVCKDIAISCFCAWCNWCQMAREIKSIKKNLKQIDMQPQPQPQPQFIMQTQPQPQTVVNVQTAPTVLSNTYLKQ